MDRPATVLRRLAIVLVLAAVLAAGSMAVGGADVAPSQSDVSPAQSGMSLDFNNQSISNDRVTVENVNSDGTPAGLIVTYEQGGDQIVAGLEADQTGSWSGTDVEVFMSDRTGVPGNHTAHIFPAADRSQDYTPGDVLSDTTSNAVVATDSASISPAATDQSSLSALDIAGQGSEAAISPGTEGDVSVVVENTGGTTTSFEVTLNILAPTPVIENQTTATLAPDETETVTFQNVTPGLDLGRHDVSVTTTHDDAAGRVTVTNGPGLSNLDVAGQGTAATITEGTDDDVTVEVTNVQDSSQSFDVDLSIGNAVFETETTSTLAPDASETLTFDNVTGGLAPGNYDVSTLSGQAAANGSLTVESQNPPAGSLSNLDIAGQGTSATITEGDQGNVSVLVENTGAGSGTIDVGLTIDDANDVTLVDETQTTGMLAPGETETVVFVDVTSGLIAPDNGTALYDVQVTTDADSVTGDLTVEGTTAESSLSNLNIAGQGQSATIMEGEDRDISVDVTNVGSEATSFTVDLNITDTQGNPELTRSKTTGTLSGGGTVTVTFENVTAGHGTGFHLVTTETVDDQANGDFEVTEAVAESALSGLDIAGQGTSATIVEGTDEDVSVVVENNGTASGSFDVTLDIQSGPTANVTETQTTSELAPDQTEVVTFTNVTGGLDLAEYQVTVATENATVIGDLTVDTPEVSALSNLDIGGQGTSASLTEGEEADVTVDVENVGTAAGTFEVVLEIGDDVTQLESTGSLSPGQSQTITFADATGEVGPGTHDVTVSTDDDNVTGDLTVNADSVGSLSILDIAEQGENATIVAGADEPVTVDVENVGSLTESISVTLTVGTATSTETTAPLSTGENETVTFPDLLSGLDAGSYAVEVSTDDDSATGNLTVQAPPESALSGLDVAGQGSSGSIVQGDSEDISVDVGNVGGVEGEFDVTLEVGGAVTETQSSGRVGAGANTTVTFIDVTGSLASGSYPVTVSTDNDTVTGDLTVAQPAESALSGLNIAGQGPEATVTEGALANLSVDVQNVGEETGTFDVTLLINGAVETEQTNPLAGGESQTVTFTNVNDGLAPGNYPAEVSTTDDTATGNMTVEAPAESSLSNLDIAGQGPSASVHEGVVENVTVDVENVGDQDGSFAVTLDVGGESRTENTGTLAGDATGTVTFDNVTGGLAVGNYTVDVSTPDDALSGNLTVTPPPTATLSELDVAEQDVEATIAQGIDGDISVNVTHNGDNESFDVFPVTLEIGEAVEMTTNTSELRGTFSERVTFENVTGGLGLDSYNVTVSTTGDEVTGNLTVVEPPETTLANLDVAGEGTNATITDGDIEDVSVDVTNVGQIAGTFDLTLEIGGSVSAVQTVADVGPDETRTVTFDGATAGVEPGEYAVTVSSAEDSVAGNLTVEAPPEPALSDLDVAGQGANATITEGDQAAVTAVLENVGDQTGNFTATLEIGDSVTSVEVVSNLASGATETVSFADVTGGLPAGTHNVTVTSGESTAAGTLTVQAPAESALADLDIAGQGTSALVGTGAEANVSVLVENVGDLTGTFEATLEIGANVSVNETVSALAGGETARVTFANVTPGLAAGTHDVTVSTADDTVNGSITVLESTDANVSNLDIAGAGSDATVSVENNASITADVTNVGNVTAPVVVTLTVGEAVTQATQTADLAPDETATVTFENVTGDLATGEYPVTVSAGEDAVSGTLTVENVTEALTFLDQRVSENGTVAVEAVSSGGVTGTLLVTYEAGGADVVAGMETGTFEGENVTVTVPENVGFPATYEAHLVPTAATSGDYAPGDTVSSATLNATVANGTARVTTVTGAPDIEVVEGQPAKDTTGDGLLNDVRGDGSFDIFDVQSLFNNLQSGPVQNNEEYFNFQGSEPPSAGVFDVQALFGEV